jgi:hypothetical protein
VPFSFLCFKPIQDLSAVVTAVGCVKLPPLHNGQTTENRMIEYAYFPKLLFAFGGKSVHFSELRPNLIHDVVR